MGDVRSVLLKTDREDSPGVRQCEAVMQITAAEQPSGFALFSVKDRNHPSDEEQTWRSFEDALASALHEEEIGRHQIRSLLSGKSPAANIVDVARTLKPDLIVRGANYKTRCRSPAWRHIGSVLVDAPRPVLTISED